MKIYCRVTSDGLVPLYDSDLDNKKKLKLGSDVCVEIKKVRNIRFHKKLFALIRLVLDNMPYAKIEEYKIYDEEAFLIRIKHDLHMYDESPDGVIMYNSINFVHMDEFQFEEFYKCVAKLMISKYIKCSDQDIEEEIYKFL